MAKLSKRAKIILAVIREQCRPGSGREPGCYFVPSAYPVPCNMFPSKWISISGSGDAAIIKSIIARGYATEKPVAAYACQITDEGIAAYEALRQDPDALADQKKKSDEQEALAAKWAAEDADASH